MTEGFKEEEAYHKVARLEANQPLVHPRSGPRCPRNGSAKSPNPLSNIVMQTQKAAHDLTATDGRKGRTGALTLSDCRCLPENR